MSRKTQFVIVLGLCLGGALLLGRGAQWLEQRRYPLMSSLTCIETGDGSDLYWNVNQIEVSGSISTNRRKVHLTLTNNVPHFDSYRFRLDGNEQWRKSVDGLIDMDADEGSHRIELKALNALGGETASMIRTIRVADNGISIIPDEGKIECGKYGFRFESPGSEKIAWLRKYSLPAIAACPNQWKAFLALRSWVSRQIPNKYPAIKSRWDAQRILQAVWNDSSLGFICDAYAATYVSACISVGFIARMIHLGDERYNGHYVAEVWSDEHHKWILMDPLYDVHFELRQQPLSAIELHHLWKEGRIEDIVTRGGDGSIVKMGAPSRDYANLLQDIQLINANDFLTTPFSSVADLLTLKIRFLRYVDESNPPYDRLMLLGRIVAFYYLPMFIAGVIIPFVIPAMLLLMILKLGKKAK